MALDFVQLCQRLFRRQITFGKLQPLMHHGVNDLREEANQGMGANSPWQAVVDRRNLAKPHADSKAISDVSAIEAGMSSLGTAPDESSANFPTMAESCRNCCTDSFDEDSPYSEFQSRALNRDLTQFNIKDQMANSKVTQSLILTVSWFEVANLLVNHGPTFLIAFIIVYLFLSLEEQE